MLQDGTYLMAGRILQYTPHIIVKGYKDYDNEAQLFRNPVFLEYPCDYGVATGDHITPHSKGGSDDLDNLVVACFSCNSQKGASIDYKTFKAMKAQGAS